MLNVAPLRSERGMMSVDYGEPIKGSALSGRISPPLFFRNADTQGMGSHKTHMAVSGIEMLKDVLKPVFMDVDKGPQEDDMVDNMRIAEGWRECQSAGSCIELTFLLFASLHQLLSRSTWDLRLPLQ